MQIRQQNTNKHTDIKCLKDNKNSNISAIVKKYAESRHEVKVTVASFYQ